MAKLNFLNVAKFVLFVATFSVVSALSANAQSGRSVSIVRDAEIEALLKDYTSPILRAANLQSRGIDVVLVNDRSFNAFVSGRRIFVNIGAILQASTPNEIIGVLAHEAGHLAGNHQERLRAQLDRANTLSIVGALLGVGAIVAGDIAGSGGGTQAGTAITSAAPSLARRALLSYRRSEEVNADSAALKYLKATKQSAKGMLVTFEKFSQQLALSGANADPYRRSHPLPRDRIALLQQSASKSPYFDKRDSKGLQLRHDMARAKIAAFTGGAQAVARAFQSAPNSLPAAYGSAVAMDLAGRSQAAIDLINRIIKKQPSNPYLYEFRGELQLKTRQADQAVKSFAQAIKLDKKKSGLIQARLGFAYVATGNPNNAKRAISALRAGLQANPNNINAYRTLSNAYALAGDVGEAELAIAEGYFKAGNTRQAKIFAGRAVQKLVRGDTSWQRARDILTLGK